jgi:hypothetical protein
VVGKAGKREVREDISTTDRSVASFSMIDDYEVGADFKQQGAVLHPPAQQETCPWAAVWRCEKFLLKVRPQGGAKNITDFFRDSVGTSVVKTEPITQALLMILLVARKHLLDMLGDAHIPGGSPNDIAPLGDQLPDVSLYWLPPGRVGRLTVRGQHNTVSADEAKD